MHDAPAWLTAPRCRRVTAAARLRWGAAPATVLAILLATGTAVAQTGEPPAAAGPTAAGEHALQPAPRGGRRFFDGVGAMIGDKAILHSSVEADVQAWIDKERASGREVTREQAQDRFSIALGDMVRAEAYVQGALTGGALSPAEFQERLDRLIDRYRQEQIEKYGSVTRWTEELGALGRTWGSVREEKRRELLEIQSRAEIFRRVRGRVALLVTPARMRRFFDENVHLFESEASADIGIVALPASDDAKADLARARAVATAWRAAPDATADAIAGEHGGTGRRLDDVRQDSNRRAFLLEFARDGDPGEVSEPQPMGSWLWIMKIVAKREAQRTEFDDPRVQRLIVEALRNEYLNDLERQLRERHAASVNRHVGLPMSR